MRKTADKNTKYYIELPIPQEVNDANSVTWGEDSLNIFQLAGLAAAQRIMTRPGETFQDVANLIQKGIDLPNVDRKTGKGNYVIFGQVVGIYINDKFIKDGLFNASAARPLVRLGYMDYGVVGSENTFSKNRPKLGKDGKLEAVEEWDGIYR